MDPISFTASLVAIFGIAGAATKLSITLYNVACKAGPASLGIERFATDIGAFAAVVQVAHDLLNEHYNVHMRLRPSLVLQSMKENEVLDQLVAQSRSVMSHIKLVRPRLKSMHGSFDFITRLKWYMRKTEIQALGFRVESLKSSILLVVGLIQLETAKQQAPSAKQRQRIKDLELQIKLQLTTIKTLQDRIEQNNFSESPDVAQSAQDVLISLGQTMTRHSRRSRRRSRRVSSSSFHESNGAPHIQETQPPSNVVVEEAPPPRTRPQSIISVLDLSVVPNITPILYQTPSTPHIRNSSTSLTSSHSRPRSIVRDEGDYVSVRPFIHVVELSQDHEIESVTGFINGVYITAVLDHDLDANLISQAEAVKLGLQVQTPSEENIQIKFGNHQEQGEPSMGTTTFEWSEGPSSTRRPFIVHCFVCTHDIKTLILGGPFIERIAHYWPPRSHT